MDIGGLLTGGGGIGVAWGVVQLVSNRRKLGADTNAVDAKTAAVLSDTARELIEPLREQIKELRAEVTELKQRVRLMSDELDAAHDLNRSKDDLIHQLTRPHPPEADIPPEHKET